MAPYLDESRRLTGPNLFTDHPGTVMEVYWDGDVSALVSLWSNELDTILRSLELNSEPFVRYFEGGANIGFTAQEDMLYTACEINETAFALACSALLNTPLDESVPRLDDLRTMLIKERNPALIKLIHRALEKDVCYLTDDDEFSLGMGRTCQVWPIDQIPDPDPIDFSRYQDIPVAFVTGTNGKSTSVRMADAVAKAAGFTAGVTSTDYIRAGDEILDRGDYSGPGGARTLIRSHQPDMAILEVARGGMLRRGLGVSRARAALITNVADDHLGQYGINTVKELIAAKGIVSRALNTQGTLVLNADDSALVAYFKDHPDLVRGHLCYFSLDADNAIIKQAILDGHSVIRQHQGQIQLCQRQDEINIVPISEIPTALNGAAQHNVANAMGVAGLCLGLGLNLDAVREGLMTFQGDVNDNPGRGNYFDVNGSRFLVDFAHNAHSLTAVVNTVAAIPAKRRLIMLGHAGDRTDRDIINLTDVALKMKPDKVVTAEIPDYLRGRALHEIPNLIKRHCIESGLDADQVQYANNCLEGAQFALDWAAPGDFVLLLALDQREQVFELLS